MTSQSVNEQRRLQKPSTEKQRWNNGDIESISKGMKKGNISKALAEAIDLWIDERVKKN